MGTKKGISNAIGQAHEFFMKMEKFGWTDQMTQQVITDKELAQALVKVAKGDYEILPKKKELTLISEGIHTINPLNTKKSDFFKEGKNGITKLLLSDNFKNIFLPLVDETIISEGSKVEKLKLTKTINDFQIQQEISGKVDTTTDIAAKIIALTSAQPKGEDGVLLNNGCANIFYFKKGERVFYVRLYWDSGRQKWLCCCSEANGNTWYAGHCVFATATQRSEA